MQIDTILCGDALERLRELPDACVQCCVTSPPYWGLRDYGVAGQIGLEATPDEWVNRMVEVFREVARVLRDDGTLWLNVGDCYATHAKGHNGFGTSGLDPSSTRWQDTVSQHRRGDDHYSAPAIGLKDKDLIGLPWRVAFALQADGWYLRADCIWSKPNTMPESVTDRPTRSHEYMFLFAKQRHYFYDRDAIREPLSDDSLPRILRGRSDHHKWADGGPGNQTLAKDLSKACHPAGRNKRSVWTIATQPFSGAHFAVMPSALVEPCILAGTSPKACEHCGAPWQRVTDTTREKSNRDGRNALRGQGHFRTSAGGPANRPGREFLRVTAVNTTGWDPGCRCQHNTGAGPSVVLDPFMGAGTTAVVARRHSRHYLGVELNPAYIALAEQRIANEIQPVLWSIA